MANDLATGIDIIQLLMHFKADAESFKITNKQNKWWWKMDLSAIRIYKVMRPGNLLLKKPQRVCWKNYILDPERYDLTKVGRMKMNHKLGVNVPGVCYYFNLWRCY